MKIIEKKTLRPQTLVSFVIIFMFTGWKREKKMTKTLTLSITDQTWGLAFGNNFNKILQWIPRKQ